MKTRAASTSPTTFVAFAAAAVLGGACGRETQNSEPPVSSTSLTSAEVIAGAPPQLDAEEASCVEPIDDPVMADACAHPAAAETASEAPPPAAVPVTASAPKVSKKTSRALAFAAVPAKAKSRGALNEAIAHAVDDEERENATAAASEVAPEGATPASEVGQTSLTSAEVPALKAEPALRPARVAFDNRLSSEYRLERVRVLVDGAVAYDGRSLVSLEIPAGAHTVKVLADYRLQDPVFSYVRDYHLELQSTEAVPASTTPISFVATAVPAGGVTTPMNQRAALSWRSRAGF
ncbi:MAG TPA: hypothetical protein VGI39_20655 [Polyangiaceae bacterium]